MYGTQSYYDMGVTMVDCIIVIVYTLHVWGPLELWLFIVHWVNKRRLLREFDLGINAKCMCVTPCLLTDPYHHYRSTQVTVQSLYIISKNLFHQNRKLM